MKHLTRRTFLKHSAVVASAAALSARSWGQVVGANSDVRVAVIGLNGRGKNHLESLAKVPGAGLGALCGLDTAVVERVKNSSAKGRTGTPYENTKTFTDLRDHACAGD